MAMFYAKGEKIMKYCSEITKWGAEAFYFLTEKELNFIVLFNEGAPAELMEISILHKKAKLLSAIAVDDTLLICDKAFNITAIGDEALHTFKEMGHCTICFKGGSVPERPGCIMVEGEALQPDDIHVGGLIEIY